MVFITQHFAIVCWLVLFKLLFNNLNLIFSLNSQLTSIVVTLIFGSQYFKISILVIFYRHLISKFLEMISFKIIIIQ